MIKEIKMSSILIVEDDVELNNMLNIYLSSNGFECDSCFDGEKAFDIKFVEYP